MGTVHRLYDSLKNAITGAGTSRDPRMAGAYAVGQNLTQNQIDAAYRGSGLMRKIIQIPALDMVREWRDWKIDADLVVKIEAEEKRLGLIQKVRSAEILRGLGGGALVLGLPGNPSEPAAETIRAGQLAYVHVVSRWHLQFDKLQDDATKPGYGEPDMWRLRTTGGQVSIHPSRVVPFRADTEALLASPMGDATEQFWGESRVAQVLDAVQDSDSARSSFASLLHKARLTRVGIPELSEISALPGGEKMIQSRLEVIALAESMFNVSIYDRGNGSTNPGEQIDDITYSFAGAKDVLNAYAEFASAISDIPATRLLGRAPEGMNSSGDGQQEDWRKKVRAMQTLDLAPCLDRVDRYLVQSATGSIPAEESWYEFAPLDTPSQKETAERFAKQMEALDKLAGMSVMPERAFNEGAQSLLIEEGYMPGLEAALKAIPDDERFGIEPDPEVDPEIDPAAGPAANLVPSDPEGGDPAVSGEGMNDAAPRPLYVYRKLLNAADLIAWAKGQGLETTLPADDMHVTVLYSKQSVDPMAMGEPLFSDADGGLMIKAGGPRALELFGEGALVLQFSSWALSARHADMVRAGASHDYPEYAPHVTITYQVPDGFDAEAVRPYAGELRFGPEIFEPLDPNWKSTIEEA